MTLATDILNEALEETEELPGADRATSILAEAAALTPEIQEPEPEGGFLQRVGEAFTGSGRETRATRELPEIGTGGLLSGEDEATIAKVAPAILSTIDPAEIANILSNNFRSVGITQDEAGNLIAANNRTGAQVVINKPGLTPFDVIQGLGLAAAFTPAAKAGSLAVTTPGKALAVGGASAATQAGLDIGQQAAGRTPEVSAENISGQNVAIAGLGGATFEALFQGLARMVPAFRQAISANQGNIPGGVRARVKAEATAAGIDPETITDDVIADFIQSADEAVSPGQAGAIQGEREFGARLTAGERVGTQQALRQESVLRERAPQVFEPFEAERRQTLQQAATDIRTGLGGDDITSQVQAGGVVAQGVRTAEQVGADAVSEAFEAVGEAALKPDSFVQLLEATKQSIRGIDFPITAGTTGTTGLLKQINTSLKFLKGKGVILKPVQLERIEQVRRSLGEFIGTAANPTDKRNLTTMKNAFDDHLDNAVQKALFDGDQEALQSLKNARQTFKRYAKQFRAQPVRGKSGRIVDRDQPGQFIEKIISANPTDVEVVNAIFGAGETFGKAASRNMANRFKTILGEGSDEWNALRQAGFQRLIKAQPNGVISGQQTMKAINKADRELLDELYSAEEQALFRRFAAHVQRTQPIIEKSGANPSGTARQLIDTGVEITRRIGNTLGMVSGNPAAFVAGRGFEASTGRQARAAIRPFQGLVQTRPLPVSAGTAGAVQTLSEENRGLGL